MKSYGLIDLKDGVSVRPDTVTSINPLEGMYGNTIDHPARVRVCHGNGLVDVFNCQSNDEAKSLAKELMGKINKALS